MGRRSKTHESWQRNGGSQLLAGQLCISGLDWLSLGFDLFIRRGRLHSIETHWTFPILVGRSCQREIGTCTALRRDATHCFRDFEADTLPKYNTLIIPTPTKLSCDGQLYWDRNYSADIVRRGSLLQQQVPLKAFVFRGEMRSHQESGINQTDYLFIATWERNSQALTLERQVIRFHNICL